MVSIFQRYSMFLNLHVSRSSFRKQRKSVLYIGSAHTGSEIICTSFNRMLLQNFVISGMEIRDLIFAADLNGIEQTLVKNPTLANAQVSLPDNPASEHPLHRICDAVFAKKYSEETGVEIASLFIRHGANVNVDNPPGKDSPLTAACSLRADQLALFYLSNGARIDHQGCHGGTALHWAAWCGRDVVVQKLLTMNPEINQRCIDFKSTPLFWAIHGYKFGGTDNLHHQVACAQLLLQHGADPSIPNFEGYRPEQLIHPTDVELSKIFQRFKS